MWWTWFTYSSTNLLAVDTCLVVRSTLHFPCRVNQKEIVAKSFFDRSLRICEWRIMFKLYSRLWTWCASIIYLILFLWRAASKEMLYALLTSLNIIIHGSFLVANFSASILSWNRYCYSCWIVFEWCFLSHWKIAISFWQMMLWWYRKIFIVWW